MLFAVRVASKTRTFGQAGQLTPSAALFGSPVRANAATLLIIAAERSGRPGLLAVLSATVREERRSEIAEHEGQVEGMGGAVDVVPGRRFLPPRKLVVRDVGLLRLQRAEHVVAAGNEEARKVGNSFASSRVLLASTGIFR